MNIPTGGSQQETRGLMRVVGCMSMWLLSLSLVIFQFISPSVAGAVKGRKKAKVPQREELEGSTPLLRAETVGFFFLFVWVLKHTSAHRPGEASQSGHSTLTSVMPCPGQARHLLAVSVCKWWLCHLCTKPEDSCWLRFCRTEVTSCVGSWKICQYYL